MAPLVFVTGNANKLAEVRAILSTGEIPVEIIAKDFDLPELQGTTQEIAVDKCRRAAELVGGPCITEDTALCFKALGNLPGPYIKWFIKSIGNEGLLKLLEGFSTTEATAITTFAYSSGPGFNPILFEGSSEGRIVPARGPPSFGWTPIFEEAETRLTYAEMPIETKNKVSQRYKALEKLRVYLRTNSFDVVNATQLGQNQ